MVGKISITPRNKPTRFVVVVVVVIDLTVEWHQLWLDLFCDTSVVVYGIYIYIYPWKDMRQ